MAKSNETELKKSESKTKKLTKSELKTILKTADIDIVSNDKAQLVYKCPITFQEIYLDEYGDTESVTIDVLQTMKSKAKDFLRKYWIIIEDVYVPNSDVEVTVEDVYGYLGLSNVYANIKDFNSDYLDNILLKDRIEKFEERLQNMDKKLVTQLTSRAVELYQQGEFTNSGKMLILEDLTDNEYLFKESDLKTKKRK